MNEVVIELEKKLINLESSDNIENNIIFSLLSKFNLFLLNNNNLNTKEILALVIIANDFLNTFNNTKEM
jgi:hypothetical protein